MTVWHPAMKNAASWLHGVAPGLAVVLAVAITARLIGRFVPATISEVLVAVVLGLLIANTLRLPAAAALGIRLAVQRVLRLGIILLGARLSLGDVVAIGSQAILLIAVLMAVALVFAYSVGRLLGLPRRLALLIGVGTAVCGNSAIIATAPVVEAKESEVSFAVATITLFGTLAVFVYPLIGAALQLSQTVFGLWSGTAINDTSQVVAAAAAYGTAALGTATVVKLTRNALMAPLLLGIAWWWGRGAAAARRGAAGAVPLFVLGFLAVVALRTVGLIQPPLTLWLDEGARFCILLALAGVGLNTSLATLRAIGLAPFLLGLGAALIVAALSLSLITAFGLG
ncbi:MAG: putative sulfate exporter family transporter [Chloroflexota bacterium]|nr:putative sulfate exporter family transporter [Dehalococcoidia bacterium]MDW8253866.1 putative sulfate exporter family transporter [Chloroflexota bacterium]